jgi:hypothetical protein
MDSFMKMEFTEGFYESRRNMVCIDYVFPFIRIAKIN